MKRFLACVLALSLSLSLAACGDSPASEGPQGQAPAEEEPSETGGGIELDEGLLSVDITLPAVLFEGEDMSAFDPEAYAEEQGFQKAVLNDDGSLTVTMTRAKHKEMLAETAAGIEDGFAEMIGSEDAPYITEINHSASFDTVDIVVDRGGYENAGLLAAFLPLTIYVQTALYQAIAGEAQHCEIKFVDSASGDTIESVVYPDALNSGT